MVGERTRQGRSWGGGEQVCSSSSGIDDDIPYPIINDGAQECRLTISICTITPPAADEYIPKLMKRLPSSRSGRVSPSPAPAAEIEGVCSISGGNNIFLENKISYCTSLIIFDVLCCGFKKRSRITISP
jgi:hypothetical protein